MKRIEYLLIASFIVLTAFSEDASCGHQGVKGRVLLVRGNQMPSPDAPRSAPVGLQTTLFIYELTNTSQVTPGDGSFYKAISSKLVKEVESGADGTYKAELEPGMYSLFVKKGDLFYSNIFDDKMNIHPIEVKKGKWTEEDFKADYDAVY
jgi:hypothetical protein